MWRHLAFRKLGPAGIEIALLVFCVLDAFYLRFHYSPLDMPDRDLIVMRALLIAFVIQFFLQLRDVYDYRKLRSISENSLRLAQALIMASTVLLVLYSLFPILQLGRGVLGISLLICAVFLFIWQVLLRIYIGARPPRSNILVLGTGKLARDLVKEVLHRPELGMRIKGFVDDNPALLGVSIINPKVIGLYHDLPQLVQKHQVDRIIVALKDRRGRLPFKELLDFKTRGIDVEDATTLYERVTGKIAIENLNPSWMIFNTGFQVSRRKLITKRALSLAVSLLLLMIFSPAILLAMILIKLDSPGPVFHRQERVGQDGRIFTLWKFRSMRKDAERDTGPVWATQGDSRVTRVGKILRRTRLDELPQLYNVFRGDMDIVGPRPERPCFVEELAAVIPYYQLRHAVKPGVTGWAQINYQYANSVEHSVEKLQYDLFYTKNLSFLLDFFIILRTVKTVLVEKGS